MTNIYTITREGMMYYNCYKKIYDEKLNTTTGLIDSRIINEGYNQFHIWNKNNNCKYFKKRFFARKKEKKFCKDCKYFFHIVPNTEP